MIMTCQEVRALMLECLTGTTPPDTRRAILAHLEVCAACRAETETMEETVGLLRTIPEPRMSEQHWASFMGALEQRLLQETAGWRRLFEWTRNLRLAWSTAAATSALLVALGIALLVHPTPPLGRMASSDQAIWLNSFMTESMVQSMPSMAAALDLWKAGLTASEVPYEIPAGD